LEFHTLLLFLQHSNKYLKKQTSIKKILALGIMLLLSISMLPQKTLHEWLGCHKDRTAQTVSTDYQLQVSKQSLHCSCDQPEFQSPFIISTVFSSLSYKVFLSMDAENMLVQQYSLPIPTTLLRGPPEPTFV